LPVVPALLRSMQVRAAMAEKRANGMAIGVIDDCRVAYVDAYGARNAKSDPMQTDTVMYGASLTKTVMAYITLTLVARARWISTRRSTTASSRVLKKFRPSKRPTQLGTESSRRTEAQRFRRVHPTELP